MRTIALKLMFFGAALAYASAASAYVSPGSPTGFVNDFALILQDEERTALETKLSELEKSTGAQVSVVTIKSLEGDSIENFAVKLFEEWGIGKKREDTGILLLVSPFDREVRIEVGYGLEPVVTDAASSGIIRNIIVPAFREEDYARGIDGAVDALSSLVKGELGASEFTEASEGFGASSLLGIALVFFLQLIPVIIYSKSWWFGGVLGFGLGLLAFSSLFPAIIVAIVGLILDYLLSKAFAGKRPPGGKGGVWFGGMGKGYKSGGGFGGFGGGSSGGGGASGRW